jgi:hypothetical protein
MAFISSKLKTLKTSIQNGAYICRIGSHLTIEGMLQSAHYNLGANGLHPLNDCLSILFRHPALDHSRRLLHQLVGLLQPQVSEGPDLLDHLDLARGVESLQTQLEHRILGSRGCLLPSRASGRRGSATAQTRGRVENGNGGSGRDVEAAEE